MINSYETKIISTNPNISGSKPILRSINEKNVIGFMSFIVMTLFAIADLVTSFLFVDGQLVINEVIYNSFVWVTLGCFGISAFEKVKK